MLGEGELNPGSPSDRQVPSLLSLWVQGLGSVEGVASTGGGACAWEALPLAVFINII